jgi:UDP-3-O-[3-hydroxymyristoyl] glucosamine N-acyltransferase
MTDPAAYFDLTKTALADLFAGVEFVWEVLDRIRPYVQERIRPNLGPLKARFRDFIPQTVVLHQGRLYDQAFELRPGDATKGRFKVIIDGREASGAVVVYGGACFPDDQVELGPGVVVESGALIKGPTIIGALTEVRQGAYVRGDCLVAGRGVVGHVSELKNAVFLEEAKAGHFAYVGDSVLGLKVNLGAGTKLANLKISSGPIRLKGPDKVYQIERRKFGAIVGDSTELGCNTVTSPGCLLGPRCLAVPNSHVPAGLHKAHTLFRPVQEGRTRDCP